MDGAACRIHSKTARHGTTRTDSITGIRNGSRELEVAELQSRGGGLDTRILDFCFSPRHRTEGEWCAHGAAGVCACVCFPVWITMMQSAAVLPTESPVKSLPEILGVPLQRKTMFRPLNPSSMCCRIPVWGRGGGGVEEARMNLAGCRAQANNVASSSHQGAL